MSWKDRLAPWARFIIPTTIPGEQKKVRWLKLADNVSFPHMDEAAPGASMDQLTATFGHILHAPLPKPPKIRGRPKSVFRRTVSPVMPHPAAFTELAPQNGTEIKKQDSIVVHFIPAPGGTSTGLTAPPLKLTMPFSGDEDFSNFNLPSDSTLKSPKPSFVKDLLFPEEAVDVRVERHRDLALAIDQQSAFKDFIEKCEFNLAAGRLQTPSNTRFSIPRGWLTKAGRQVKASDEVVDLPYLFGGLEIHQTIDLSWQNDIVLRYESIEAGQHGGTRQELSLLLDLAGRSEQDVQTSVSDLLTKLGMAVEGKYWPWSRGAAKVHELPHNNDPIWDQFRPRPPPAKTQKKTPQEQPSENDDTEDVNPEVEEWATDEIAQDEPGGPVEGYQAREAFTEGEHSPAVPRSEPINWNSGPLAPHSQRQQKGSQSESQERQDASETIPDLEGLAPLSDLFESKQTVASRQQDNTADEASSLLQETEAEQGETRQAAEHESAAPSVSDPNPSSTDTPSSEIDSRPSGPSTTQTSTGPFSPTPSKQRDNLPRNLRPRQPSPATHPADHDQNSKSQPSTSTDKAEKDRGATSVHHGTLSSTDNAEEDPELLAEADEYETMDPEALAAKLAAKRGKLSLEEMYKRAGATAEQVAALREESKRFEEKWKIMSENGFDDLEEQPRSKEEIEKEDKLLKQYLAEDIAREEAEREADYAQEEDDDMDIDVAKQKRGKKIRNGRG